MSTPIYRGPGQPSDGNGGGILGLFGGLFGTPTPAYEGDGQPSASTSGGIFGGLFGGDVPTYQSAPIESTTGDDQACASTYGDPYVQGPITLVIPPQGG